MNGLIMGLGCVAVVAGGVAGCCLPSPEQRPPHIVAKISDAAKYERLNPHFGKAFKFLRRPDLADLKPGRYEIDGENCWAMIQDANLTPFEKGEIKVEAHRKYIDIQSPITGPETFGLFLMDDAHRTLPFNGTKDIIFFNAVTKPMTLNPGEFAIFFPPDGAHAPGHCIGGGRSIRKLVIKVLHDCVRDEPGLVDGKSR